MVLVVGGSNPGVLSISPQESFQTSGNEGGPFSPTSKEFTVSNTGGSSLDFTVGNTQTWTTVSPTSGTLATGASTIVTVSLNSNADSLGVAQHTDTISFTNTTNGNGSGTRSVVLVVGANPGVLAVSPQESYQPMGDVGGPFSPASKDYTVSNSGGTSLDYTVGNTQSWNTLSSSGGTLAAGGSDIITITINSGANALSSGTHGDTISFTNTTNSNGDTTRLVNLQIGTIPGTLSVTPDENYDAKGVVGGTFEPASKDYTISNTGGMSLDYTVTSTQSWLALSGGTSGTLIAGGSAIVTVTIDNTEAQKLTPGTYTDTLTITNTTNGNGDTTQTVNLEVENSSLLLFIPAILKKGQR